MSSAYTPLSLARVVSLFLAFVFGVVGLALNAEAFVRSTNQKSEIKRVAPQGTSIHLDNSDVVSAGGAVLAFSTVIALVSLASLVLHLLSPTRSLSTRTLPLQGVLLAIGTLGLFASLVAMTDFVANRQVKVSASIGGTPVPASLVQSVEQSLGVTPVYHKIFYLKRAVILPWFAFLFGAISTALSFASPRNAPAPANDKGSYTTDPSGEKQGQV
ncbi:hypothetical protein BD310DRAFT_927487 [Dichomitus squalens]|uniref:Transmembrane protein n=1 Tax=Dichomitus squalens TaxID=114155 RepID=A0A4Q9PVD7_9APHY|nr:hypothetical protein BD310DRAFT_927487 [Dichomitus squalens]